MNKDILSELQLPEGFLKRHRVSVQMDTVEEAISFKSSYSENGIWTQIYDVNDYEVGVYKPGKEFFWDENKNINDMKPTIRKNNKDLDTVKSFTEIFEIFENMIKEKNLELLQILGSIFFRNSFMLDHHEVKNDIVRYQIPEKSLNYLKEHFPMVGEGIPIDVFLYFLDVIGLNEDVKYHTLGHDISTGTGRGNNFGTYANMMALFTGKQKLFKFAGSLGRPPSGVAPLSAKAAKEFFGI